jgi:hypothetical protein
MKREDAIKAVDDAFVDGVKRLYAVFVQGLSTGEKPTVLGERFRRGLAVECDAHGKTTAIVEDYFKCSRPDFGAPSV